MNARAWASHKTQWCHRCRHNSKRKPCPLIAFLDKDPQDEVCNHVFHNGRCSQYEARPSRKKKTQQAGRKR